MISENPLVSVIIPCYNHERYIRQCIQSVLNQTYSNIQLIVLDDGSKDNSFAIIEEMSKQHGFFAEKHVNRGLSATLNKGIKNYAKGKYICIVASDDYWEETKVAKQVTFYQDRDNLGFIFGRTHIVNDFGDIIDKDITKRQYFDAFSEQLGSSYEPKCDFNILLKGNYIPALTVMLKKSVFDTVGYFDESMRIEDWDMWLRIAFSFPFEFMDDYLGFYRIHETNVTHNRNNMVDDSRKILLKWSVIQPNILQEVQFSIVNEISSKCITDKRRAAQLIFGNLRLFFKDKSFRKSFRRLFLKFRK